ncbi:family 16 glycosylhydrolase [Chitinophaga filiformis]|uniref:Glycosyl hydrolases family 16 n=1 Tax=Chitinophaga filiformis TaxID=104663 RepID=A0A1G7NMJ5_CHIFI|nr:family 16 glycosylhydrolase [Chitinophaga filiformis]SDF74509.1 Glycosyl hydrolases family 16 [Chitinophaga filiformis]
MKKQTFSGLLSLLLLATAVTSCTKENQAGQTPKLSANDKTVGAVAAKSYQLVWSDEFDGTSLNTNKWGYENGNLGVNNEKQFYQTQNVAVTGGNLVITARKETVQGQPYTSGRLNSNGKFSTQYGRIEARIKLPGVQGLWPAFWMLGNSISTGAGWPACGEIDIMEQVNTSNTVLGTIHWWNTAYTYYSRSTTTSVTDFHVYAIEWDASSIHWFVDGAEYNVANIQNNINGTEEFHAPFFILLNVAVGGNLPGNNINDAALPASMLVDYVRVYNITQTPGGGAPIGTTISIKGNNGSFVSGENGTQAMNCNRPTAQGWEQFTIVDAGGGKVALQSMGKYVSSENGVQAITCNRTTIQDWEKFDWIDNGDGTFSLRGNNGAYVSSENGVQAMTCNRPTIQGWEKFTY